MSVQTICAAGLAATTGNFNFLVGRQLAGGASIETPMAVAGAFSQWRIQLSTAPGGVTSRTWTLFKNGSSTALTVTIAGAATTGSDMSNSVSYAAGDTLKWVCTASGAPATSEFQSAVDFTPTTSDVSVFAFSADTTGASPDILPFGGDDSVASGAFLSIGIVACAGTITGMAVATATAPGSGGDNFTYRFVKNGTLQDGTGGTVDTSVQILNAATSASATFSLSVAAGDLIAIRYTPGGPSPAGSLRDSGTFGFAPTTAEQTMVGMAGATVPTGSTSFMWPHGVGTSSAWSTTEALRIFIGGTTDIVVAAMYVEVSAAPGVGKSRAFTLRKNGSDSVVTATVSGASTTANITGQGVVITAADQWTLQCVPSGTPAAASARISLLIDANASPTASGNFFALLVSP